MCVSSPVVRRFVANEVTRVRIPARAFENCLTSLIVVYKQENPDLIGQYDTRKKPA